MEVFKMKNYTQNDQNEKKTGSGRKQRANDFLRKGMAAGICAALVGGMVFGTMAFAKDGVKNKDRVSLVRSETSDENTEERTVGSMDVSDIVEKAMPSIVSITTQSVQEAMDYYSLFGFNGGYAPQQREVEGRGSGVIIGKNDDELLIVTNAHVVDGAEKISVGFINNKAVEALVKGYDDVKDIAVVAVKKEDIDKDTLSQIKIAEVGSSDDTKIGEQVVVIGNAMGYGQSVTTGIVSAKTHFSENSLEAYSQTNFDDESGVNLIQTDAAINPGNSGGALLNMDGELIGINQSKLASTEIEGMCYAIAISDVDDEVIEQLMNEEYREKLADDEHGILGITGSTVSAEEARKFGFPEGVYVAEITEGSPADKAGIKAGDFITNFEGKTIDSINRLVGYLSYYAPGEEVDLTISRDGEKELITVTLGDQTKEYRKEAGFEEEQADDETEAISDNSSGSADEEGGSTDSADDRNLDDIWNSLGE